MNKRLLTLDDLYSYYSSKKKSCHFSSKNEGDKITVQVNGTLNFEQDDNTENLLKVKLMACHTGVNRNQSNISEEVMSKALPSFSNRPILGYIYYNEETSQDEFKGHEMHMDDNGELIYDEKPVGIIPESCDAHFEEIDGKQYVVVDGYIFDTYSKAGEILRREKECFVSIEISVRELSYDAKEKVLNIDNMFYEGVTILGRHESGDVVEPGMENANIKISDFKKNNSLFSDEEKLKEIVSEVIEKYSNTLMPLEHKNISRKEENEMSKEHFEEEVLSEIPTDAEEVVETEEEVTEEFETESEETESAEEENETEETFETSEEELPSEENETEEFEEEVESEEEQKEYSVNYSISLNDQIYALSELVNATYSESDNDYYSCTVYSDEKYVVMNGWFNSYRQSYKVSKGNYMLTGDRVPVYAQWLTQDEIKQLESMKSNYAEIEDKLAKYETEPQKMEILTSEDYSSISEVEEFIELQKTENHFDMSVEELSAKCDEILLHSVKENKANFALAEEKKETVKSKPLFKFNKSKNYGSLLS